MPPGAIALTRMPRGPQLLGERFRQHDDAAFRGVVMDQVADRLERVHRGDVDDRSAPARVGHFPGRGLGGEEESLEVQVEGPVPHLLGDVEGRHHRIDARVVHQQVDAAVRLARRPDRLDRAGDGGHVRHAVARRAAPLSDVVAHRPHRLGVDVGQQQRGARLREARGDREADALRCAGDDRHLAAQVVQLRYREFARVLCRFRHAVPFCPSCGRRVGRPSRVNAARAA